MSESIPLVKTRGLSELLALIPVLAGLELRGCLAVAPFWGTRTTSTFRISLPEDPSTVVASRLTATALTTLDRLDGCDGVAVVAYTDGLYAATAPALSALLDSVLAELSGAGYDITAAAIVAADGWRGHAEDGGPHDPAELEAAAALIPREMRDGQTMPEQLPARDGRLAARIDALTDDLLDFGMRCDAFGLARPAPLPDPVDHLETLLEIAPETTTATQLATLLALIQTEGAVDRTVLQIAFGPEVARAAWTRTLALRARAAAEGCQPQDIMTREAPDDPASLEVGRMLVGETQRRPDAERLHRGAILLGRAVANCSLVERSWAMCALVWLRWAVGLNTAADELIRSTYRLDPFNSLVTPYAQLIAVATPAWIYDRRPPVPRRERRAARRRGMR